MLLCYARGLMGGGDLKLMTVAFIMVRAALCDSLSYYFGVHCVLARGCGKVRLGQSTARERTDKDCLRARDSCGPDSESLCLDALGRYSVSIDFQAMLNSRVASYRTASEAGHYQILCL